MFVEASPQVNVREFMKDGVKQQMREQACGFWAPGQYFPVQFFLRLRDDEAPLKPGRYALHGTPVYRPYEKTAAGVVPDRISFERFQLVPMSKAQEQAAEAFRAAFAFVQKVAAE